jgi:hypothetical protein
MAILWARWAARANLGIPILRPHRAIRMRAHQGSGLWINQRDVPLLPPAFDCCSSIQPKKG